MNKYRTTFSLEGIPQVINFVDRPVDMAKLEQVLLPRRSDLRQKVLVLHGLGGIGKTQLAGEFVHRFHGMFSSVFWLDGSSAFNLKLSIAKYAARIPIHQISDASRLYSENPECDIDQVVSEVIGWLESPENIKWLLVFDNVDRDYGPQTVDPLAYDIRQFIPSGTCGSVLITTRLTRPAQLGSSQLVNKMGRAQARELLKSWYSEDLGRWPSGLEE